uniref:Uncharacterized protein n=1 Tax=Aplanochytrium stocchinoi TaxID=215587 RepID=A0A7S3PPW7_9STRA|mmetsp:Transcript_14820/g.18324  ORF Transcript_14820/g.18324 Transcript_14820/m.18324 type:complete len:225 (-) Transcript_14820:412-1086(-)
MYITICLSSSICLLSHFVILQTWSQMKRRLIWYVFFGSVFFLSALRLADENRLFGEDIAFTTLFAIFYFFLGCTGPAHMDKFITFQIKLHRIQSSKYFARIQKLQSFMKITLLHSALDAPLICILPFVERPTASILIKSIFAFRTFMSILWIPVNWYLITLVLKAIDDIEIVASHRSYGEIKQKPIIEEKRKELTNLRNSSFFLEVISSMVWGLVFWPFVYVRI